jgi:hypothetical protein
MVHGTMALPKCICIVWHFCRPEGSESNMNI